MGVVDNFIEKDGKLYNEKGQVAIVYSPGFGAGWSTWNAADPTDDRFAKLILAGNIKEAKALAESEGLFAGGLEDCNVVWLDAGTKYRITEYDGSESVELADSIDWEVA